jgi:hypothetical protein
MAREALRDDYAALLDQDEFLEWLGEGVTVQFGRLGAAEVAEQFFGRAPGALDLVFLATQWHEETEFNVFTRVGDAIEAGHSWRAIAAALGVSRQAAVKRYREWAGKSVYERAREQGIPVSDVL